MENIYFKTNKISDKVNEELAKIKEPFCCLSVGHWCAGDTYHDRKSIGTS